MLCNLHLPVPQENSFGTVCVLKFISGVAQLEGIHLKMMEFLPGQFPDKRWLQCCGSKVTWANAKIKWYMVGWVMSAVLFQPPLDWVCYTYDISPWILKGFKGKTLKHGTLLAFSLLAAPFHLISILCKMATERLGILGTYIHPS